MYESQFVNFGSSRYNGTATLWTTNVCKISILHKDKQKKCLNLKNFNFGSLFLVFDYKKGYSVIKYCKNGKINYNFYLGAHIQICVLAHFFSIERG